MFIVSISFRLSKEILKTVDVATSGKQIIFLMNLKMVKLIQIYHLNRRPSDLEADDEDTQDGDSLNHLKLDINLTELNIKEDALLSTSHDSTPESPPVDLSEVRNILNKVLKPFDLNVKIFFCTSI